MVNKLSFETLRQANINRIPEFKTKFGEIVHTLKDGSDWSLPLWITALTGELGELSEVVLIAAMTKSIGKTADKVKKVERGDLLLDEIKEDIGKELADCVTYLSILADQCGIDLGKVTVDKFNEVSRRVNASIRLASDGSDWYSVGDGHD